MYENEELTLNQILALQAKETENYPVSTEISLKKVKSYIKGKNIQLVTHPDYLELSYEVGRAKYFPQTKTFGVKEPKVAKTLDDVKLYIDQWIEKVKVITIEKYPNQYKQTKPKKVKAVSIKPKFIPNPIDNSSEWTDTIYKEEPVITQNYTIKSITIGKYDSSGKILIKVYPSVLIAHEDTKVPLQKIIAIAEGTYNSRNKTEKLKYTWRYIEQEKKKTNEEMELEKLKRNENRYKLKVQELEKQINEINSINNAILKLCTSNIKDLIIERIQNLSNQIEVLTKGS
jgi:hypothetical protein